MYDLLIQIGIDYLDKLSIFYNVSLAYLLSIDDVKIRKKLSPIDYEKLYANMVYYKNLNHISYRELAEKTGMSKSQCFYCYKFKKISIEFLINLTIIFNVNIDDFCGK